MTQAFVDIDRELAELRAKAIELDRVRILLAAAKKEANTLRRRPHFPERGIAITFHETRVIAETLKTLQDRGHLQTSEGMIPLKNTGLFRDLLRIFAKAP